MVGRLRARGGRFFEKKLRKKLFYGEKFLLVDVDGANMGAFILVGWRAQYLPLAKTVLRGAVLLWAHFSLGGIKLLLLGGGKGRFTNRPPSNFDLSVCYERGTHIVGSLVQRELSPQATEGLFDSKVTLYHEQSLRLGFARHLPLHKGGSRLVPLS